MAEGLLDLTGPRRVVDPSEALDALLGVAGNAVELMDTLRRCVGALDRVATDPTQNYGSSLAPEVAAYLSAIKTAERVLTNIAKLGIAERVVKLDEQRVEILCAVIRGTLYTLGVNAHDDKVRDVIARQLKLAAGLASS